MYKGLRLYENALNIPIYQLLHLYFAGKRLTTKVTFEYVYGHVRVYIQDFAYVTFEGAMGCLQMLAKNILTDVTPEELAQMNNNRGGLL